MTIKAYLKPHCGWSNGVRAILRKYGLQYEEIDIINVPENYIEMIEKSGQRFSPCVEINGTMLADVSGEEVEQYLIEKKLVANNNSTPDSPINQPCAPEIHDQQRSKTIRFF